MATHFFRVPYIRSCVFHAESVISNSDGLVEPRKSAPRAADTRQTGPLLHINESPCPTQTRVERMAARLRSFGIASRRSISLR